VSTVAELHLQDIYILMFEREEETQLLLQHKAFQSEESSQIGERNVTGIINLVKTVS
jgi:hypothetical protein